jgi:hypothetical protein
MSNLPKACTCARFTKDSDAALTVAVYRRAPVGDTTEDGAVVTISTGGDTGRQAGNDLVSHQAGVASAEVLPGDGNIDFGCVTLYVAVSGRVKEALLEDGFKSSAGITFQSQ